MVDPAPAWLPTRSHISRLGSPPKHQLADPALAARLLGIGIDALLEGRSAGPRVPRDGTLLGALVQHLRWLREQIGDDLLDLVIVSAGSEAYRRHDGIAVVPLAVLGP